MDQQQFQQLTAGLAQQEVDRRTTQHRREKTRDLVQQTTKCDGSTTSAVRMWIKEVSLAFNLVGAAGLVEIVTKTISGPLRFEIERFLTNFVAAQVVPRNAVPWNAIRDHVQAQFLNVDEAAALRDEVDKLRQSPYEPEAQYSRRFREVADAAYPGHRNADQERILVRAYARGLNAPGLARKLVEEANPNCLEAAIQAVSTFSERKDAYARLGREEQPMEVAGNVTSKPSTPAPPSNTELIDAFGTVVAQMEKLTTKVAKLEVSGRPMKASTKSPPPQQHGRRNTQGRRDQRDQTGPAWDSDGRPKCFECGKYGHFGRECSQRSGNGQRS